VLLLAAIGLAACGGASPPTVPLQPVPFESEHAQKQVTEPGALGCGESLAGVGDPAGRLEIIGEVVEQIQSGSCRPLDDRQRVCRSLFLVGATDPLVALGLGLDGLQIERTIEWHRWALAEGVDAARRTGDGYTAEALSAMSRLEIGAALLGNDAAALANGATARAEPAIIEPLVAAEQSCLNPPR